MKIKSAELETVCGITSSMPEHELPEFAFAGKSNVGKSSLINSLLNRKALARTSAQPGKTQTINFYNVNESLYFVDLPGYGYAKVTLEIREKWGRMIERYLHESHVLKVVFLLVDIRHEPSENDRIMYEWILSQGYKPAVIATKSDKIGRGAVSKQLKLIREGLHADKDTIMIPFSAMERADSRTVAEQRKNAGKQAAAYNGQAAGTGKQKQPDGREAVWLLIESYLRAEPGS